MFDGKKLRELREERGLFQEQVGNAIGVDKRAISFYENGKRKPDYGKVKKLSEFFGVNTEYFYNEEKEKDTVSELIERLINENIIKDPDNIPDSVVKMIIDAAKLDIRLKTLKRQD